VVLCGTMSGEVVRSDPDRADQHCWPCRSAARICWALAAWCTVPSNTSKLRCWS